VENFIREFLLSDPDICDGLIGLFKKALAAGVARPGKVGAAGVVAPGIKRSTELGLGEAEQRWNLREFRVDAYMNELFGFINRYLDETGINEHGGTFVLRDPPQIQWYRPGEGFYAYHIDGAHAHCHRALVFSTYLNDVDEGGGTEFFHQRLVVSAVKGKTAIFPAGLTHLHRGVVSRTREKYLLTGWLSWA
jgi:hypothetical protein